MTGLLATILWLTALRRGKVEIPDLKFFKIGIIAMPFVLVSRSIRRRTQGNRQWTLLWREPMCPR